MNSNGSFKSIFVNIKSFLNERKLEKLNPKIENNNTLVNNIKFDKSIILNSNNNNELKLKTDEKINDLNESNFTISLNNEKNIRPKNLSQMRNKKISFFKNEILKKKSSKINKNHIFEIFQKQEMQSSNNSKEEFKYLNRLNTNRLKKKNQLKLINPSGRLKFNPELENNEIDDEINNDIKLNNIEKITLNIDFSNKTKINVNYLYKNNLILKNLILFKILKPNTSRSLKKKETIHNNIKKRSYFDYFTSMFKINLNKNKTIIFMKISHNHKYILVTDQISNIYIYDLTINEFFNKGLLLNGLTKYSFLLEYTKNNYEIICIEWSSDSNFIIVSNSDRSLKIYDISKKDCAKVSYKFEYLICFIGIHLNNENIIGIACSDKIFRIIKLKNAKVSTWEQTDQFITTISFNPSGKLVALCLLNGMINIYNFDMVLKLNKEINAKTKYIYQIKFINEYQIIIRNKENNIQLINIKSGLVEQIYIVPFDSLNKIDIDFDYNLIIGINKKNNIIVWNKINNYIPFINKKWMIYNKNINKSVDYFQPYRKCYAKNVLFIPQNIIQLLNEKMAGKFINYGIVSANEYGELKIFYELR